MAAIALGVHPQHQAEPTLYTHEIMVSTLKHADDLNLPTIPNISEFPDEDWDYGILRYSLQIQPS